MRELRLAIRALRSTPVLTMLAIVSLALGIGANLAVFSLLNAMLWRPLPVAEPHRLVAVASADGRLSSWPQSVWNEIEDRELLADGFAWFWARFDTAQGGERQPVDGMVASGRMFEVLGLRPAIGRLLTPADDALARGPDGAVAVISHGLWLRHFGGNPAVLGTPLTLDGRAFTIVGVAPREFTGLYVGLRTDVVVPLERADDSFGGPYVTVMGRLRAGETPERLTAALQAAQPGIRDATNPYSVDPYREEYLREPLVARSAPGGLSFFARRYAQPFRVLLAIGGAVLLVACGNIALLLAARTAARRRELATRAVLGASARRLARPLFAEGLLLATAGVLIGALFAYWSTHLVRDYLSSPSYTVLLEVGLDWRVLTFASALAFLTAALSSMAPAWRVTRTDPLEALRAAGVVRASMARFGGGIVVTQVAVSLVLIVTTGLLLRSVWTLASTPLGFDAERVLVVTIDAGRTAAADDARRLLYGRLREAVLEAPGVGGAALSLAVPGGSSALTPWVSLPEGRELPQGPSGVYANRIDPGWFHALGTALVAGRALDARDGAGAPAVAVVNEAFAGRFLGEGNPIGRTLLEREAPDEPQRAIEVVGVVRNAMYRFVREASPPTIYTPLAQVSDPLPASIVLSVRVRDGHPAALSRRIVDRIHDVDRDVAITFRPLSEQVRAQYAQERLAAGAATLCAVLGLILAILGVYGLTAHAVTTRRVELGIRLALGATTADVVRMVLGRALLLVGSGVGLGLVVSVWASRLVQSLLHGVEPHDSIAFAGASVVLAAVAAIATWIAGRRAGRIDPAGLLREE